MIKKQWIPVSLTLLSLVSGNLFFNHTNVSAHIKYSSNQHTYPLINSTYDNNINNISNTHNNLSKKSNINLANDVNKINHLKPYQVSKFPNCSISRSVMPLKSIHINHQVELHNSPFFNNDTREGYINHGIFHISKSFNQYTPKNCYSRFLIKINNHNYFITGSPYFVSFVKPSNNYVYYKNKTENILNNSKNYKFNEIQKSLDGLNSQHIIDYRVYMSLYADAYNIQQEMHPIFVNNIREPIISNPNNSINNINYSNSKNSNITINNIFKKLNLISIYNKNATSYNNQSIINLSKIKTSQLKMLIINEINSNNTLIGTLNNSDQNMMNNINKPNHFQSEFKILNIQLTIAYRNMLNAKSILNSENI